MKKELRTFIRQQKATYSPEQLKMMSANVINALCSHHLYKTSKTILLYHSLPDEVNTHQLIADACKEKTVLLPTVVGDELELHIYTPSSATHTGSFSIVESEGPLLTDYKSIDLAIIPGMAFDKEGNRLGRGKGYYDRLLPHLNCPSIGICFPFQLLAHVPSEEFDRKVNEVIS